MSEDLICDLLDAADFVDNDFEKMLILNQVFKLDPDNISASIEITNLKDDKNIILNDLLKLEKYQKKKLATNDKTEFYSYMEILDEIINVYESKFNDTLTALKYARKLNEIDYDNTWNIDQDYIRLMLKAKKFNQLKNHIGRDIDHFESYALLHVYKHYNNKHNIKALLSSLHDYQLEILLDYNELINEANYYNDFALFIVNSDDEKLTAYFELKNYLEKLEY